MQWSIVKITFLTLLSNSILLVESTPIASSSFGSFASVGSNRREQHAEFGEGIRDWFRNIKNRLFGGSNEQQSLPPPEAGKMMVELDNDSYQDKKQSFRGGFFLDLSKLTFNPETDWGFRLGQWYFIKKSGDASNDDWMPPINSEWPSSEEITDRVLEPSLITMKPEITSEKTSSSEETPKIPDKKVEDNETRRPSDDNRSTEVLIPSE
ncbi:uncharacterized protein [Venturia canescens]|uniref:uncharacterized protein n=1 Tax=Venturia canescens TaxID=32260 RepID=UPI001C9CEA3E|nr:uncharacterized protein LOC122408816 [Venturia canescens]